MWSGITTRKFDLVTKNYFDDFYFNRLIFFNIFYRANAAVRTIRTIKKGEEILDNYGYHYAVMPREERQRKL